VSKQVTIVVAAFLALALACAGDDGPTSTPDDSPTASPSTTAPSPTSPAPTESLSTTPTSSPLGGRPLGQLLTPTDIIDSTAEPFAGYIANVDTGQLWSVDWLGTWSPDGAYIAISSCCIDGDLIVIDVATGEGRLLVEGNINGFAWSPDSRNIAFTYAINAGGSDGLHLVAPDSGLVTKVGDAPRSWGLTWLPGGDFIAVIEPSTRDIVLVEVATGAETRIAVSSSLHSWSPDGLTLAYIADDVLYVYDRITGESAVTLDGVGSGVPRWSPDGDRLLIPYGDPIDYPSSPNAEHWVPHVLTLGGDSDPVALTPGIFTSWSPDGREVLVERFGCVTGDWDVLTFETDGSSPTNHTNTPDVIEEGPAFSPDGSMIAYSTFTEIRVLDLETGENRTLAEGSRLHFHGLWSPDSSTIAFSVGGDHGICT